MEGETDRTHKVLGVGGNGPRKNYWAEGTRSTQKVVGGGETDLANVIGGRGQRTAQKASRVKQSIKANKTKQNKQNKQAKS